MMHGMTKKYYEPPRLTVVTFKVECGYAASDTHMLGLIQSVGDRDIEERQEATSVWGSEWNY